MTAVPLFIARRRYAPRRPTRADEPFTEADVVLAQLEDAVRQYDAVLDRLMQVLRPGEC